MKYQEKGGNFYGYCCAGYDKFAGCYAKSGQFTGHAESDGCGKIRQKGSVLVQKGVRSANSRQGKAAPAFLTDPDIMVTITV